MLKRFIFQFFATIINQNIECNYGTTWNNVWHFLDWNQVVNGHLSVFIFEKWYLTIDYPIKYQECMNIHLPKVKWMISLNQLYIYCIALYVYCLTRRTIRNRQIPYHRSYNCEGRENLFFAGSDKILHILRH